MKKSNLLFMLAMLAGSLLLFYSCKKAENGTDEVKPYQVNFVPAKTRNEMLALANDPKTNVIRTPQDLEAIIASNSTPLSKLSTQDLIAFKNHVQYRGVDGVVGLNYGYLERALSYDDFAIVMSFFGMDIKEGFWGFSRNPKIINALNGTHYRTSQEVVDTESDGGDGFKDYRGYYCAGRKDCAEQTQAICTSKC